MIPKMSLILRPAEFVFVHKESSFSWSKKKLLESALESESKLVCNMEKIDNTNVSQIIHVKE